MSNHRSWMYCRLDTFGYVSSEFKQGVDDFIDFAFSHVSYVFDNTIRCPCLKCANGEFHNRDVVEYHLYSWGFVGGYYAWSSHGESISGNLERVESSRSRDDPVNPYQSMVVDCDFGYNDFNRSGGTDENVEELPNPKAREFFSLLKDADESLWTGCKKHSKLSAVSQLLNCKSECNMSDSSYDRFISIVKDMLPEDEKLPTNFYRTKKMDSLGLGYKKIPACPNNCMLFYKESESLNECSVCGHPRYKPRKSSSSKHKDVPFKVLRYLPLTPRLQRLYMSSKTAKHMSWHEFNQSPEGEMRHPVDSEAWQQFNRTHPEFAHECRNVRLDLCTDGFNPFGPNAKP
ncbi:Transposon, En/Spm-like protein [Corchorus capsularis]|uniref:Transposon, En/Spm-like protein n=1 Tax=Corchorus capsularis TaxID=210143 RepID=A0A1R3KF37_COCAP|nr:Transposon, En/Spm-like protein [Corchorus capsularis]